MINPRLGWVNIRSSLEVDNLYSDILYGYLQIYLIEKRYSW